MQGAQRREELRLALANGGLAQVDPDMVREALTVPERRALLAAHPDLALGEYLPELAYQDIPGGDVEIARLYLASGIGNTISIRARQDGSDVVLQAVDEFDDRLSIRPERIQAPLTNAELLLAAKTLEWHGPLAHGEVWWTRELESETGFEEAVEFITGESEIYPAFANYVERDNQEWLEAQLAAWAD